MKTFLVTGPIGSGKSEVCRYLASKGYPVYDCDSRTKGLYESVPGLKSRIVGGYLFLHCFFVCGKFFRDFRVLYAQNLQCEKTCVFAAVNADGRHGYA